MVFNNYSDKRKKVHRQFIKTIVIEYSMNAIQVTHMSNTVDHVDCEIVSMVSNGNQLQTTCTCISSQLFLQVQTKLYFN